MGLGLIRTRQLGAVSDTLHSCYCIFMGTKFPAKPGQFGGRWFPWVLLPCLFLALDRCVLWFCARNAESPHPAGPTGSCRRDHTYAQFSRPAQKKKIFTKKSFPPSTCDVQFQHKNRDTTLPRPTPGAIASLCRQIMKIQIDRPFPLNPLGSSHVLRAPFPMTNAKAVKIRRGRSFSPNVSSFNLVPAFRFDLPVELSHRLEGAWM